MAKVVLRGKFVGFHIFITKRRNENILFNSCILKENTKIS